jgi:hypothetical protein
MKYFIIILTLIFSSNFLTAQNFENLYNQLNTFDKFEQYDSVDMKIFEVADYLLSNPIQRKQYTKDYFYAVKSLVKWSSHTPSYKILIFGKIVDASDDDPLMKNIYMAAMIKFLMEQRYQYNNYIFPEKQPDVKFSELPDVKETQLGAAKIFFNYLENVADERSNKELRKGIKAKNDGTLQSYLFE